MGEVSVQVTEPRRRPVRRPGPSQIKMHGFCRPFRAMSHHLFFPKTGNNSYEINFTGCQVNVDVDFFLVICHVISLTRHIPVPCVYLQEMQQLSTRSRRLCCLTSTQVASSWTFSWQTGEIVIWETSNKQHRWWDACKVNWLHVQLILAVQKCDDISDGSCWEIIIIKQIHTYTSIILFEQQ